MRVIVYAGHVVMIVDSWLILLHTESVFVLQIPADTTSVLTTRTTNYTVTVHCRASKFVIFIFLGRSTKGHSTTSSKYMINITISDVHRVCPY